MFIGFIFEGLGVNTQVEKSLDRKLANILADRSCKDFILADAKDADMAAGMAAPGVTRDGRMRTLDEYRAIIRENVAQGLVDIMLMSASTSEQLTIGERLFDQSHITPACRSNDTTDIHLAAGGVYPSVPSRPFRTATIGQIMYGKAVPPQPGTPVPGADLGLYSITFNNDIERDLEALHAYRDFRLEAESYGFRHFLEIFDPNACEGQCPADVARYLNDQIARTLAGVVGPGRPTFLKIPYHGPEAMEQLVGYDSNLVIGILGGAAGTTFDAFHQLWEARKYGARVALYGRMINGAEHQPTMIQHLRWLGDGDLDDPAQAVRSYHGQLQKLNIKPWRSLADDLRPTQRSSSYGASTSNIPAATTLGRAASAASAPAGFSNRVSSQLDRWNKVFDS